MNNNIFSRVGGRTPYRVPQGYFASQQAAILAAVEADKRRSVWRRISGYAAAAAVALVAVFSGLHYTQTQANDFQAVEYAFDGLSMADQETLLDLYTYNSSDYEIYQDR